LNDRSIRNRDRFLLACIELCQSVLTGPKIRM
jgi:hypothetical protein